MARPSLETRTATATQSMNRRLQTAVAKSQASTSRVSKRKHKSSGPKNRKSTKGHKRATTDDKWAKVDREGFDHVRPMLPRRVPAIRREYVVENPFPNTDLEFPHREVRPNDLWNGMENMHSVILSKGGDNTTIAPGDMVFVKPDDDKDREWLAKVCEIRHQDDARTFLRIYWMYWPENLPRGPEHLPRGRRRPRGRRLYHGKNELIASNHVDVIDLDTIVDRAIVIHWEESLDEGETLDADTLFWRQTLDFEEGKDLSQPKHEHCTDELPWNPDELLVHCPSCGKWLHGHCLEQEHVKRQCAAHKLPLPPKGGTSAYFSAFIRKNKAGTVQLSVQEKRDAAQQAKFFVPINCLICNAIIEDVPEDLEETAPASSHSESDDQLGKSEEDEDSESEVDLHIDDEQPILEASDSATPQPASTPAPSIWSPNGEGSPRRPSKKRKLATPSSSAGPSSATPTAQPKRSRTPASPPPSSTPLVTGVLLQFSGIRRYTTKKYWRPTRS